MRAHARLTLAAIVAVGAIAAGAGPVAAECTFIPPLPKVSFAVPTAKELFAGIVVDGSGPVFTVRVTEVFRGSPKVGELRHYEYAQPNWPWSNYPGGQPYPSCSTLSARPNEHVVLALGARWPGGEVRDGTLRWYQPPTMFNTIGILEGSSREQYGSGGRQLFSIERLREMVALDPPNTDTVQRSSGSAPPAPIGVTAILVLAATMGVLASLRRTAPRRDRP